MIKILIGIAAFALAATNVTTTLAHTCAAGAKCNNDRNTVLCPGNQKKHTNKRGGHSHQCWGMHDDKTAYEQLTDGNEGDTFNCLQSKAYYSGNVECRKH